MAGGFKHCWHYPGIWAGLLIALVFPSCRVTSQSILRLQNSHSRDRVNIIYRADSPTGPIFTMVPKDSSRRLTTGIMQAAAQELEEPTPFQDLSWSKAELRIECPHPDGRRDFARVTLHTLPVNCGQECEHLSWSRQMEERMGIRQMRRATIRERWLNEPHHHNCAGSVIELDLPSAELDLILAELNSHGYFSETGPHADATSHLEVRLNRRWASKPWGYEPALDELTIRVYEQGQVRSAFKDDRAMTRPH